MKIQSARLCFAPALAGFTSLGIAVAGSALAADAVVPDDFATISAAVAGASDLDSNGTVEILIRAGQYNENVQILRSALSLSGEDAGTTVIQGVGGNDTLRASFGSNVMIQNLTVVGVAAGLSMAAIDFNGMSDSVIRNVIIAGGDSGIEISAGSTRCTVNGADVSGAAEEGIKVDRSSFVNLVFNAVHDNLQDGIQIDASNDIRVLRNTSSNNGSAGFLDRVSQNSIYLLNRATANDTGFDNDASTGARYILNNATLSLSSGFRLENSIATSVVRNESTLNAENGLRMKGTTDSAVYRNAFSENTEWGVRRQDWFNDDFDSGLAGAQHPAGNNDLSGNRLGALRQD